MELDPAYCDVIVERWERFTGKKAVREARHEAPATTTGPSPRPPKRACGDWRSRSDHMTSTNDVKRRDVTRTIPPGWAVLESAMRERRWHIEVWANPDVGGFTARMTDSRHTWLMPRERSWWGHGETAVAALQSLAAAAFADRSEAER